MNALFALVLGMLPIGEKHTTRDVDTSVPETLAFIAVEAKFGGIAVPGRQYYFKHDTQFAPNDLIVDVEWDDYGKPFYTGKGIYEISHIDPQRYQKGEMVYKKIYCKDQPVQKNIRGIRIANMNGIINYEIAMEEEGTV